MIGIWRRSHYDKKNTHSMRLEDTNQTPLTIYYSRKGKGKNKDKEGSGEKKAVPRQKNEKIGERQSAEIRYQNMKKQNLFRGKEKLPQEIRKDTTNKSPQSTPQFPLEEQTIEIGKAFDSRVELEQFILPLPKVDGAISFQPTSKAKDIKSCKLSSANRTCQDGHAHFFA